MNYQERYNILVSYLKLKVEQEDWHGVSDAANDLREMMAEEQGKSVQRQYRE